MKPRKGKAVAKKVDGKKRSYGQAGKTPKPGTAKGDATLTVFKSVASGVESPVGVGGIVYQSLADACRLLGKDYDKTKRRLQRSWTIEEAFDLIERKNTSHQKKYQQEAREIARSGYKVCATCGEKKSIEKFPVHKTCIGGVSRVCRSCKTSDSRVKRYGVTKQQYTDIYIKQGGKCAICGTINPGSRAAKDGSKSFCVDHCHETGQVRGLLCFKCNSGLGNFKDDQKNLMAAIQYLNCARSAGIKKCKNPPCPNRLSRQRWGCKGKKSVK